VWFLHYTETVTCDDHLLVANLHLGNKYSDFNGGIMLNYTIYTSRSQLNIAEESVLNQGLLGTSDRIGVST